MSATAALELPPETAANEQQQPNEARQVTTESTETRHDLPDEPKGSADGQDAGEQKEAKEAKDEVDPTKQVTATAVVSDSQKQELAARIRQSLSLPPALRDCLAKVALASADTAADGKIRVPIDDAIRAIEEALPDFIRVPTRSTTAQHPSGDSFFRGNPDEVSDAQAEEIARGQLTRSGLLRGQRVRVAEE